MDTTAKTVPHQPRKLRDVAKFDYETDIAIVGFGGAGAAAAIDAADAGASVMLFEAASASGGSTLLSSAEIYMGGNGGTPPQVACGYEDKTEDMIAYLTMAGGPQADVTKVKDYCENSRAHYDWLISMGVPYKMSEYKQRAIMALTDDCLLYTGNEKVWPFNEVAKPCPRGHNIQVEGDNGGKVLIGALTKQVENRSDKITVKYDVRALTLIVDDHHRIVGIVIRENMEEKTVKARKGVILCAGGFVMNEEMVKKYAPRYAQANMPIGNPNDTGGGILMGMGVGASVINMDECFVSLPYYPPQEMTYGILVNSHAQRFINEDSYHGRVGGMIMQQLGDRIYMIFNAEGFKAPMFLGADIAGTGDTIEELAEELNLNADMLKCTIDVYNKNAANGEDPLFHKAAAWLKPIEAPYAALDCTPGRGAIFPYFTLGGLETLPTGEVLDPQRQPIKGLYAAGRTACGIPRIAGGYSSGMSVGDATYFGRMAGKTVAAQP